MPSKRCYFVGKAEAASAAPALKIFCSILHRNRCLHKIWDIPPGEAIWGIVHEEFNYWGYTHRLIVVQLPLALIADEVYDLTLAPHAG